MARFSAPLPVVTLASLALVLSACGGGQSGADSQVSETSVVPPAGTSSASVSSSASESVAPSAQTAESSAPASSVPVALPTLASGKTVEFTPEELAAYQKGEYVPASEKHPAYNVPVPVMPEVAKTQTLEGAKAFAEYWRDCMNYTILTGDASYIREVNDEIGMEIFHNLSTSIEEEYAEKRWITETQYTVIPAGNDVDTTLSGTQKLTVLYTHTSGKLISPDLEVLGHISGDGEPGEMKFTVQWTDGKWVAILLSGE